MNSLSSAILPFRGLFYLLRDRGEIPRRVLWQSNAEIVTNVCTSLLFLALLYTKGWTLQAQLLSGVLGSGKLMFVAVQLLLASETAISLYLLARSMLDSYGGRVFDAVLRSRGISEVRPLPPAELEQLRQLAKDKKRRQSSHQQRNVLSRTFTWGLHLVGKRILTAPLLLMAGVGWAAYLWTNSMTEGASCHERYFQRKGITDPAMVEVVTQPRAAEYRAFGSVLVLLNMAPAINWALSLGGPAGAALWAADMELQGASLLPPSKEARVAWKQQ